MTLVLIGPNRQVFPKGDIMEAVIILASFGTSHKEGRRLSIEAIENRVKRKYKDFLVLSTFTSQLIINKLRKRENYLVNSLREALEKANSNKVQNIYIQPLFILPGKEYEKLINQANEFSQRNPHLNIQIGKPLLFYDMDYDKVVEGLSSIEIKPKEGLVFMVHGSNSSIDRSYERLECKFRQKGYKNIFIGSIRGSRTIDHIIPILQEKNIGKVKLVPFMLVAGRHALNDMVLGENSWKEKLLSAGIQVEAIIRGLGEIENIQDIYMDHLSKLL